MKANIRSQSMEMTRNRVKRVTGVDRAARMRCDSAVLEVVVVVVVGREGGGVLVMNHSIIHPSLTRFHQWGLHPIPQFTHPAPL